MPRSGRASISSSNENVEKVNEIVSENRHTSLRKLACELNISHESARILPAASFVRHVRKRDLLDPTFLKRIITGDEMWGYEYDMQTSQRSAEYTAKNMPKPKPAKKKKKKPWPVYVLPYYTGHTITLNYHLRKTY